MTTLLPITQITMREPGPIQEQVTRYRCPHCRRSYAYKSAAAKHMLRCFKSPFTRACKSCRHYDRTDGCVRGVDLDVARCSACGEEIHQQPGYCPSDHEDKPVYGLRVQCPDWEVEP